jgi:2-succinyl-6-hydroxy-2,4-cyclohexadiene-1-carboxylate synthase
VTRLVFIPGFMQRGHGWADAAERLGPRHEPVLLDHSEHSFEGRLAEIAKAGEGAVLAGYSLGGRLAMRAAVRDPARYRGLVTVGTTAGIDEAAARSERAEADERLASWIEAAGIDEIVGLWERQPLFADQSEQLVEAQRAGRLSHDPSDLAMLLRTSGQGVLEPVWGDLLTLDLPVLAIAGARDEAYTAAAKRIAATAKRGRAAIVENAGHAPQLQQPEAVAKLLTDFVDQDVGK